MILHTWKGDVVWSSCTCLAYFPSLKEKKNRLYEICNMRVFLESLYRTFHVLNMLADFMKFCMDGMAL